MACDVHHVPGRIRFKIPGLRNDSALLGALPEALSAQDGVDRVEIRHASNSLIVHYDPRRIPCHRLADTVNRKLTVQSGRPAGPVSGNDNGNGRSATPWTQMINGHEIVPGPVRQVGIIFGQAAFKVALEQAVRGGLNSLFRVTLGRG